ncbi:MAG: TonB-dependent receptor plug domain-containing protein [Flavobacteriales bacterium]|nr:TonB-dependent receptor plug domain-containing protein [Flavobacteriales bacterium]
MKKNFLSLLAIMTTCLLMAQNNGSIKGTVVDQTNQEPLPFANVWVDVGGDIMGTTTDLDGKFTLKPLPPGVYTLNIAFLGYNTVQRSGVRVLPDKIKFEDKAELTPVTNELGPIIITGESRDPLIDMDDPKKTVMLQSQIKQRADKLNIKSMAQSLAPGITSSPDGNELYFRGSRAMAFNYYIDGIKVTADQRVNIPSRAISSVSVYAGGVPAKYGDVTGGVIIIETMTYNELYRNWKAHNM